MRTWLPLLLLSLAVGCAAEPPTPLWEREIIDLTHTFDRDTIYWPTAETGFVLHTDSAGVTEQGFYYSANSFMAPEHGGTHLDAPIHFYSGGQTLDAIPVSRLIGPGVLIDVSDAAAKDRDYLVSVADLEDWERRHGPIPNGAIVLLRTGFGASWPDRESYLGTAELGPDAIPNLHFPGLAPEAATWLATERTIGAVGLDTPSIDHGPSVAFDAHVRLMEHDIPALENVARLERLPENGFTVIALPMKIGGGSGGPVRIVAILD